MSNPLKKTMVYLGLAEEEYETETSEVLEPTQSQELRQAAPERAAQVTPLRRVTQPKQAGSMNEILTVHPTEYRDAQTVAASFREGIPVIINLSRMTETDAKRMIDFSSGLAMGLGGRIERVTNKVFLLSPEHIVVSGEDVQKPSDSAAGSFFVAQ